MNSSRIFAGRSLPVLLTAVIGVALVSQACSLVGYEPELTSIEVTHPNPTIARVTTEQFTATGKYNDDSTRDVTAEVQWSSSNPAVASVSSDGLVTPAQGGTVVISASLEGVSGDATLAISNALLASMEVTPADPSIANGTKLQFTATGHFDDLSAQDLTAQATWTSSEPSVTIGDVAGSKGLASSTELGPKTATITATFDGISGETTLAVKAVTLQSVSVAPASAEITVGRYQQFTATGTFSDASTQDMTNEVAWRSSNTSVATVSSTGRAQGISASTTSITATSSALLGSKPGSAQLTVKPAAPGY